MKNIFFDLDGTIIDSGEGIINSLRYCYRQEKLSVPLDEVLRKYIGPPLIDSFQKYSNVDPENPLSQRLLANFQKFYTETGWKQLTIYPQVIDLLIALKEKGYRSFITTAKPEPHAIKIIDYLNLNSYFSGIYGADLSEEMPKSKIIATALRSEQITDPNDVIMVGDRDTDVLGAKANKINTIGVLYGYGTDNELKSSGAIATIEQPLDLINLISSK